MTPIVPNESNRVLVLMPTLRDSERTRQMFEEAGISSHVCGELSALCAELRQGAGALLLTDEALADDSAGQLAEALRDHAPWSTVPIIVVAREGTSQAVERSALQDLGSVIVVERPVRMRPLLSLTQSVLRGHAALRRSQAALAAQAEQLRNADRRKDEFLATLAHELRNPLAPIRTALDLLGQPCDGAAAERALSIMDRQLKHMVRLIDDLLDVSRITQGRLELKRTRLSLGVVLDAAIEANRPHLEAKRQQLRVDVPDRALPIDADLTRMAQVVSNLLNNASKYTPAGGSIELCARREGDQAVVEVSDDGIGIPQGQLAEVFEMFSRVNRIAERSQEGLGIGLALVRRLVEMHGGSVEALSPGPDQGSTFALRLPLADTHEAEGADQQPAGTQPTTKRRILVVDDNEDAADMLALMLTQAEYETRQANDGPSALAAVEAFTPDVVILDIGLPGMSGYDVARALRKDKSKEHLELIALTGWGSREDRQRAFDAGFDVHLTKPVGADMLYRTLAELERRDTAASPG